MRLSEEQQRCLLESAREAFGSDARVWIFGSRIDERRRGGDIDVYVECDRSEKLVQGKLDMRRLIWSQFGEQKLDIVVRSRSQEATAIHEIARTSGEEITF